MTGEIWLVVKSTESGDIFRSIMPIKRIDVLLISINLLIDIYKYRSKLIPKQ
jgi:hypothetical protein